MKFLVVVPTIRRGLPGFDEAIAAIEGSFTQPTEFHVLDGAAGKTQTLNRAFDELLMPSDCDVYATIDDDYIPGAGWQDDVQKAFEGLPRLGAASMWLGDSAVMLEYVGAHRLAAPRQVNGVTYRTLLKGHHIAGCMIAFRREAALAVGKVPETAEKYQIWEDAWRGRRVQLAGFDAAFIVGQELPRIVPYEDRKEYLQSKEADIVTSRLNQDEAFRKGGVADSWTVALRRKIAQLRGRSK
jgi:hypothetical protein